MSREDNFIRIYCEIMGVSESTARYAFIMHDAFTPDETSPGTGRTVPVSPTATLSTQASPSASAAVRTVGRDDTEGLDHGIGSVMAAVWSGRPRKPRPGVPSGILIANCPSDEPPRFPSAA